MEVALLANMAAQDNRTVMGKTIKAEARAELSFSDIKLGRKEPQICSVPQDEQWRLPFLDELLSVETNDSTINECFSSSDVKLMISSLFTSATSSWWVFPLGPPVFPHTSISSFITTLVRDLYHNNCIRNKAIYIYHVVN